MTFEELHEVLDDEARKISLNELENMIYAMKQDCINEQYKRDMGSPLYQYYNGEANAFYICLKLLEHIDEIK